MGEFGNKLKKRIQDIKLTIVCITKFTSFSINIMKGVYKNYINHDKVIDWREGYPVFSSFSPPALSKVQANMEARNAISLMQNRKHPNMINIAVTDKCNCDCDHCSFNSLKSNKPILTKDQICKLIYDAQKLGVCTITFLGGEPLMREDILDLIKSVDKDLSVTLLFTNGWFLKDKAKQLKKAGLNSVNVSIDSASPKKHDSFRNKKGLFKKAISGIKEAKKQGLTTGISTCISKEQVENGELNKIIELGKSLGVNEVIIFDNMPTGKLMKRNDLVGKQEWTKKIIKIANTYNKQYDYPGIYAYSYIKSFKGLGCAGGTTFFYISPYGDMCPCDFNPTIIGNVLKTPLQKLWDTLSKTSEFQCSSFDGCKMQDIEYRKRFKQSINFKKCK